MRFSGNRGGGRGGYGGSRVGVGRKNMEGEIDAEKI